MKNLIKNLILFLIILANTSSAFSYILEPKELKSEILKTVNCELNSKLKNYNVEFKTSILSIPYTTIKTQEENKPKIEVINQNQNTFLGQNLYRRVLVKTENGEVIKSFPVSIRLNIYKEVLIATDNIQFNQVINESNSKLEKREISRYLGKTISNTLKDEISKRNFQKGNIILSNYVKSKSSILKNSNIDIVFVSKGLNIKVRGKALKDGSIGDSILVKTDKYNRTYTATVKSSCEAVVRI